MNFKRNRPKMTKAWMAKRIARRKMLAAAAPKKYNIPELNWFTYKDRRKTPLLLDTPDRPDICPYAASRGSRISIFSSDGNDPEIVPRIRRRCPLCNRMLTMRIEYDHDGEQRYIFPRHKKKGWYKKRNKKKSRETPNRVARR